MVVSYFSDSKTANNLIVENEEKFSIYIEGNGLTIYRIFAGEIRMGPEYFLLKSEPQIPKIESDFYGDWFYKSDSGIYLQKWNTTKDANTDLIYIAFENFNVTTVKSNITSVSWTVEKIGDKLSVNDYAGNTIAII